VPRLLLIALTVAIAPAQQQPEIPSPYQIAEALSSARAPDVANLMTRLGFPAQLDETSEFRDLECAKWTCRVELTGAGSIAVRVSSELAFRIIWMEEQSRSRGWAVRGYLDGHSKYGVQLRFVGAYLLIETTWVSGFPSASMIQTLYEPRNGKLVPVLQLPSRGHEEAPPPIPSRTWTVILAETRSFQDPHELVFLARLRAMPRDMSYDYLDERRVATFLRPKGASTFQLDPARSDITQRHLDNLFAVHDGTDFDAPLFLNFTRASLLQITRGSDPVKRRWLRAYLAQAPPSPIKSQLLRALGPSK